MKDMQQMPDDYYIFGSLFVAANKMDTLLERELKEYGITSKQWFLTIMIDSLFDNPPTMKEVAKEMESSHQNVKQVALKLQEKGLLKLVRDKKDARVTRLMLTEESNEFWERIKPRGNAFMEGMFKEIDTEALARTREVLTKVLLNLNEMGIHEKEGMDEE